MNLVVMNGILIVILDEIVDIKEVGKVEFIFWINGKEVIGI